MAPASATKWSLAPWPAASPTGIRQRRPQLLALGQHSRSVLVNALLGPARALSAPGALRRAAGQIVLNRLCSLALLFLLGLVSAGQWHLLETLHAEPLRFANPGQLSLLHQLTLVSHGQLLATGNLLLALALLASWAHQLWSARHAGAG